MRDRTIIVAWPLFSYLDPLTLWACAGTNRVSSSCTTLPRCGGPTALRDSPSVVQENCGTHDTYVAHTAWPSAMVRTRGIAGSHTTPRRPGSSNGSGARSGSPERRRRAPLRRSPLTTLRTYG